MQRDITLFYSLTQHSAMWRLLKARCVSTLHDEWQCYSNGVAMFSVSPFFYQEININILLEPGIERMDATFFDDYVLIETNKKRAATLIEPMAWSVYVRNTLDNNSELFSFLQGFYQLTNVHTQDNYSAYLWTWNEIKNGNCIYGHPFFNVKGYQNI